MDQIVKRIRPKDFELSTIQDNLANAIDQLLANPAYVPPNQFTLFPTLKNIAGPGSTKTVDRMALWVKGDESASGQYVVQIGSPATETKPQYNAPIKVYGLLDISGMLIVRPPAANGVAIVPGAVGPAFYITNVGNTSPRFVVTDTGAVSAQDDIKSATSVSAPNITGTNITGANILGTTNVRGATVRSDKGFAMAAYMGGLNNSATQANTAYTLVVNTLNQALLGATMNLPIRVGAPRSGSVVGISVYNSGATTANCSVQFYRGTGLAATMAMGQAGANVTLVKDIPKDTPGWGFNAGEALSAALVFSANGGAQCQVTFFLEMAA